MRRARITPETAIVLVVNVEAATRYTVVPVVLTRTTPVGCTCCRPVPKVPLKTAELANAPKVAEVCDTPVCTEVVTVVPAGVNWLTADTSQSPAVNARLVTLATVPEVNATLAPVAVRYSPTLPAFALLFVVVPTMPAVCEGVNVPVAERVVKAPAAGFVTPIDGGDAK
jgi:hypothetical protein